MKNLSFVLLALIILVSGCIAQHKGFPVNKPVQISFTNNSGFPDISGNRVVWEDIKTDRNLIVYKHDIYLYDLEKRSSRLLVTNQTDIGLPHIYGDFVSWRDFSNRSSYLMDLRTGQTTVINGLVDEIYKDKVLLRTHEEGHPYQIIIYSITNGTTSTFEVNTTMGGVDIYEDSIVFSKSDSNHDYNIYLYNISNGEMRQITSNKKEQSLPRIYKNIIVWRDFRNDKIGHWVPNTNQNIDIYMYDLNTGKETQITSDESAQDNPRISGDYIVWVDYRNGNHSIVYDNPDVYLYDLKSGKEIQITHDSYAQYSADIDENTIVWMDKRDGKVKIFAYRIGFE